VNCMQRQLSVFPVDSQEVQILVTLCPVENILSCLCITAVKAL
jgi:hypothetical protein